MKTILLSGLILLFTIPQGCKKTGSSELPLQGNWQLAGWSGGIAGVIKKSTPDSVNLLSLKNDHTYKRALNGHVFDSGTYSISVLKNIFGSEGPAISFNGNTGMSPQVIALKNDTLSLMDNVYDGFGYMYIRASGAAH
ncbi:hypothetical protein ACX0G9_20490 [Flavitalea flava]